MHLSSLERIKKLLVPSKGVHGSDMLRRHVPILHGHALVDRLSCGLAAAPVLSCQPPSLAS